MYYKYDAWGNILSITGSLASTVGQVNPFRYRGYYYDTETGFYYLNSRYYDPSVGRFLNADGLIGANGGIQGYNMFAYCNNNPVMFSDPSGYQLFKLDDPTYDCYNDTYDSDDEYEPYTRDSITTSSVWSDTISILSKKVKNIFNTVKYYVSEASEQAKNFETSGCSDTNKKYKSIYSAARAWDLEYRNKSKDVEYGALLLKTEQGYTYSTTIKGSENGVVLAFIALYAFYQSSNPEQIVGFIHTHPDNSSNQASEPDLFLLNLPGIDVVYVVPYVGSRKAYYK